MHLRNVEYIAKAVKCDVSPKAEKIINRINACDGFCPCVNPSQYEEGKDYRCPCSDMEKHLKEKGHCCCNLFIKKKPIWKFWGK